MAVFQAIASAWVFYPLFILLVAVGLAIRCAIRYYVSPEEWDRGVRRFEHLVLTGLLLSMLGFAVLQIILRNLFHTGLVWVEPLLRHLVLWIGFSAAVVAAGRLRHIHMDVIGRLLPESFRLRVLRLTTLAAAVVCMVLARASWIYLGQEQEFGSTGFLQIPVWVLTSVIFLGFALMAKRFAARAFMPGPELSAILREGIDEPEGSSGEGRDTDRRRRELPRRETDDGV
ncbi:MAG: TRAP transporter small permease subunit [Candidatus Eisenbacteria sp.]|nr:TRAP transporter small permease subunit [Candidatus Eisenbacteria bacterium]